MSDVTEVLTEDEAVTELLGWAETLRRSADDDTADHVLALVERALLERRGRATTDEPVVTEQLVVEGVLSAALALQLNRFVRAFATPTQVLVVAAERVRYLSLTGVASQVQPLREVVESLETQARSNLDLWWGDRPATDRPGGVEGFRLRRQHVVDFVAAATARVERQRSVVDAEER